MQSTFPSYKPSRNNPKKPLIVLVFLSLLASLFPYPLLTSQAKTPKIIASKPQNQKISKNTDIPGEYKRHYEDASKHKEIKKQIVDNTTKYHRQHPYGANQIVCNDKTKGRLLCLTVIKKTNSTFFTRFAGNAVISLALLFNAVNAVSSLGSIAAHAVEKIDVTNRDQREISLSQTAILAFLGLQSLSTWMTTELITLSKVVKENPQSHIIIYDIRDCQTDPQCPDRGSKNKSAKKSIKTAKKTKS